MLTFTPLGMSNKVIRDTYFKVLCITLTMEFTP